MSRISGNTPHVKIFVRCILIIILTCYMLPVTCYPQVSSSDLINNARQYDGQEVTYQGEAIGDVMVRGKYAWVNLNDTKTAIGVWMPAELARRITYTGSYKVKGDIIEVVGQFHRACADHGGDLDIHAKSLRIIKKGTYSEELISLLKVKVAIAFLIICLTLAGVYFIRLFYGRTR